MTVNLWVMLILCCVFSGMVGFFACALLKSIPRDEPSMTPQQADEFARGVAKSG